MDPNATVTAWMTEPTRNLIAAYNEWRTRGGFSPTVEILPHTDLFMMGERWGTIVKLGRKYAHVKGNRSGRVFRLTADAFRVVGA